MCPQMTTKALTDVAARNARPKAQGYKLSAGGGLYLEVMPNGAKYWRMKYRLAGREKRLSIGVYPVISLKRARFVRYLGEGHVLRSPANIRDMWQRIFAWFDTFSPGETKNQQVKDVQEEPSIN